MDDLFPCKQMPTNKNYTDKFDAIFGHGEYDPAKHSDTWNKALIKAVKENKKETCFICERIRQYVKEIKEGQFMCSECIETVSDRITEE